MVKSKSTVPDRTRQRLSAPRRVAGDAAGSAMMVPSQHLNLAGWSSSYTRRKTRSFRANRYLATLPSRQAMGDAGYYIDHDAAGVAADEICAAMKWTTQETSSLSAIRRPCRGAMASKDRSHWHFEYSKTPTECLDEGRGGVLYKTQISDYQRRRVLHHMKKRQMGSRYDPFLYTFQFNAKSFSKAVRLPIGSQLCSVQINFHLFTELV